MTSNTDLVDAYYAAFARRDGAAMAAMYAPDATFSDPAFPDLKGPQVGAMWKMLTESAKDFRLEYSAITDHGDRVTAHWESWYVFSVTGRKVHNVIDATIWIKDGKIVRHVDDFDFWRWSKQSLGAAGVILGWTPFLKAKIQGRAGANLVAYMKKNNIA